MVAVMAVSVENVPQPLLTVLYGTSFLNGGRSSLFREQGAGSDDIAPMSVRFDVRRRHQFAATFGIGNTADDVRLPRRKSRDEPARRSRA